MTTDPKMSGRSSGNPVFQVSEKMHHIYLSAHPSRRQVAYIDISRGPVDCCVASDGGRVDRVSSGWRVIGGLQWLPPNRLVVSGSRGGSPAIHVLDLNGSDKSFYSTPGVTGHQET